MSKKKNEFLYHGTARWDADRIVKEGINLYRGRVDTDFGQGFYVTTDYPQAFRWAMRQNAAFPAVVRFKNDLKDIKILDLSSKKCLSDWKHIVYSNRVLRSIESDWIDPCAGYDCVIGPMADGKTAKIAQVAIKNRWPEGKFFSELGKIIDGSQIAIKTEDGIKSLGKGTIVKK